MTHPPGTDTEPAGADHAPPGGPEWAWGPGFDQVSVLLDLVPAQGPAQHLRIAPERAFSGASMIKTFLAELVSTGVAAGSWRWTQALTVDQGHRIGGDGVLKDFTVPAALSLHDLMTLMLTVSDNTATNVLIDLLGGVAVMNERLAAVGLRSRLRAHVGGAAEVPQGAEVEPDPTLRSGPGLSVVLPSEHHALITRLAEQRHHQVVWGLLGAQQDRRSLARRVDDRVPFAHKTGTVAGVRHDSGRLELPDGGWLQVTCFSDSTVDLEWVDHPSCLAMGDALAHTLQWAGHGDLVIG